ncbi:MAG: exodeoxyribonuclease III [Phycisphaerales bacterium]|nr:exodeoxyribonuclease III [Phycisphaerales bacterium]
MNSIKARLERVLDWLGRAAPDVVCLQEIKVVTGSFPHEELAAAGYQSVAWGQKTYNGVAILSRTPIDDVSRGFTGEGEEDEARLIAGTINGVRIISAYMPNGGGGEERFAYKLEWMAQLLRHLRDHESPDRPLALCGDYNIAPHDDDVASLELFGDTPHVHPKTRQALAELEQWGLKDVFRPFHPEGRVFSWWDYRMLGFPKNRGMRIDHVFATESLAAKCSGAHVERDERKGKLPSDHAPVVATFDI